MSKISIHDWQDSNNEIRKLIVDSVLCFLAKEFNAEFALTLNIDVRAKNLSICDDNSNVPCICRNRDNICLPTYGGLWCQFIFQISHELCHAITSQENLPQKIKWFDEFICCFASYYVLNAVANGLIPQLNILYEKPQKVFKDYLNSEQKGYIYDVENIQEFFSGNYQQYLQNENLIKNHDVFYLKFYANLNGNFGGLSIIGKFLKIDKNPQMDLKEFLQEIRKIANEEEISVINELEVLFVHK